MRHHGGSNGIPLSRNHVFDSNGPEIRIRGTAQQLFEKYLQLGRDATSSGDRVTAEGFFQHAEHYFRILNAMNQAAQQNQQNGQHQNGQPHQNGQRRHYQPGEGIQLSEEAGAAEAEDGEARAGGEQPEAREIPIAVMPPDSGS